MTEGTNHNVAFETARLALAQVWVETSEDLDGAARRAAEICADTLAIDRTGIWVFGPAGELECVTRYARATQRHDRAASIVADGVADYRTALARRRAIPADDALAHPALAELREVYLRPGGVSAMLAVPVFRRGQPFGVLCLEHLGQTRRWTAAEAELATSVAEVVASLFEQAERARIEIALRDSLLRLRDYDRLLEVRRLAQNVAHDFNNVLTSAMSLSSLLEEDPTAGGVRELREVFDVGRRLASGLLRYSSMHPDRDDLRPTPALATLRSAAPMLEMLARPQARLALTVEGDEIVVGLTALELEQLVLNLCINARDAISERGVIEVTVRGGKALSLHVRDDGSGMTEAIKARMFEPFFTTKTAGTGVGLLVVHELVRKAGGDLAVDSGVGRGTTVNIRLPAAPSTAG